MTYQIFPRLLPHPNLQIINKWMRAEHDLRPKWEQSGFPLIETPEVLDRLSSLVPLAENLLGGRVLFDASRSSCRRQLPNGEAMLGPHQDKIALDGKVGLTFWIPLQNIDDETPTIGVVATQEPERTHMRDKAGYAIIDDNLPRQYTVLSPLDLGTVVVLWPLTVHTTYVPAGATKERLSLDVRVFRQ